MVKAVDANVYFGFVSTKAMNFSINVMVEVLSGTQILNQSTLSFKARDTSNAPCT